MARKTLKPDTGRPSSYQPDFHPAMGEKLARLGATDKQIAEAFGVALSTVAKWKVEHSIFSDALKAGKTEADATIADALFHRAKGYSHEAVKILQYLGRPIKVRYVEHYPPDTTACIFWLKNRQPALWRDRVETSPREDGATTTLQPDMLRPDEPVPADPVL